ATASATSRSRCCAPSRPPTTCSTPSAPTAGSTPSPPRAPWPPSRTTPPSSSASAPPPPSSATSSRAPRSMRSWAERGAAAAHEQGDGGAEAGERGERDGVGARGEGERGAADLVVGLPDRLAAGDVEGDGDRGGEGRGGER